MSKVVRLLIDRQTNIEVKDNKERTSLYHSILSNQNEVIELLLNSQRDIHARHDHEIMSPSLTTKNEHEDMAK